MAIEPGCYSDIPEAEYHASEGLSVSRLKRHRKAAILSTVDQDEATESQRFGTVIHTMILEPDSFDRRFFVCDLNRNSNAFKALEAEEAKRGREPVKSEKRDEALRIRDAVMRHPEARRMLDPAGLLVEQSFYWIDPVTGLLCRGRADGIRMDWGGVVVDLKSTEDASKAGFGRSCTKYLYDWQQAYYDEGISESCGWQPQAFFFVAVEKEPPYITKPWMINPAHVARAAEEVAEARAHYLRCKEAGDWPGYGDDVGELDIGYRPAPEYLPPQRRALPAPEYPLLLAA